MDVAEERNDSTFRSRRGSPNNNPRRCGWHAEPHYGITFQKIVHLRHSCEPQASSLTQICDSLCKAPSIPFWPSERSCEGQDTEELDKGEEIKQS
jgi:hypothetical protein